MKSMKKCRVTENKISIINKLRDRRRYSAGMFYTSSAGAVTSLILMITLFLFFSFTGITDLFGLNDSVYADYSISMTSSGAQEIDVLPGGAGIGTKISSDAVSVTTTCPSGYNLTTTTSVNDNNLYLSGNSSNNTSGTYFSPSNGTTALESAANTWGFYQNGSTVPTASSVFKAVPNSTASAATIRTSSSTSDSFNIYYGVAVGNGLTPGSYKMIPDTNNSNNPGTVRYYLTMAQSCLPYTVHFNPTSTTGGETISGTGTMSDQSLPVGVATALNSNTFTAPTGYEFDSWNTAQDGTGTSYQDGASVTDLTAGSGSITLYAQWKVSGYTITYMANGGSGTVASQENVNSSIMLRDNGFTRTNYYFKGWGTNTSTVTYRPNQSITPTSNMTLYAIWGSSTSTTLYNIVKSLTRGTQTASNLSATITKTNSGVYTYNASVFGAASDASTSNSIYYYRGILDNTVGKHGSDGDAMDYPNYVLLGGKSTSNTCWRIVRTTGSGGVKMIYNGKWSGSTCARTNASAAVTNQAFGLQGNSSVTNWSYNLNRVGYTFNNTASIQDVTTSTSVDTVLGSNSNPTTNNARSNIKTYVEDTWYASNMTNYTSKLEASAGYCNDRSVFSNSAGTSSLTKVPPYTTSSTTVYFGAYTRSQSGNKPTLNCPRSTVDLYRYVSGSTGVSNELKYPVALITADEIVFAGSGRSNTATHDNSYLNSGGIFWLLTPFYRYSSGQNYVSAHSASSGGGFYFNPLDSVRGVRPAISLISGIKPASGSGTATNPWIVNP